MSLRVVLRRQARDEFDEAFDWYEQQRAGLGVEFAERVQDVFDRISAMPEMHAVVYRDVRKALVRKFPYSVFYRVKPGRIVVLAVFHSKRDPNVWKSGA
jgi:plasmid stabilization system protein ParE